MGSTSREAWRPSSLIVIRVELSMVARWEDSDWMAARVAKELAEGTGWAMVECANEEFSEDEKCCWVEKVEVWIGKSRFVRFERAIVFGDGEANSWDSAKRVEPKMPVEFVEAAPGCMPLVDVDRA